MTTAPKNPVRTTVAVSLALATVVTLSGCFANPLDGLIEGAVKSGIDKALDGVTDGLLDGAVDDILGTGAATELPDGFPAEVPLPSGELEFASKIYDSPHTIWTVHFRGGSDVDAAGAAIRQQFADAGFTELSWNDKFTVPGMINGTLQNDSLMVTVALHNDAGSAYAKYAVLQEGQL